jgi:hypothetical protein
MKLSSIYKLIRLLNKIASLYFHKFQFNISPPILDTFLIY